jgi:hypothetical protein
MPSRSLLFRVAAGRHKKQRGASIETPRQIVPVK